VEAITAYTEALRIDPSSGAATLGLAELRTLLGDFRESERLLSRATAIADVRAEAFSLRAALYLGAGRGELALSDLKAAADVEPRPERLRALASYYLQHRAWVAALAVFRRMRRHLPAQTGERERLEIEDTLAALTALSAEADAVQHDMAELDWVRASLRHEARALRAGSPLFRDSAASPASNGSPSR
jgi:tetratricopeptide (TPR) repeat protein